MASWYSGTKHNCSTDNKKIWGCDEVSASVPYQIPCGCFGTDKECAKCKGTGFYRPDRCITYYTRGLEMFFQYWKVWTHKNIVPFSGSFSEQPYKMFEAFSIMDAFLGHIQEFKDGNNG